jgi:hypothetical protein
MTEATRLALQTLTNSMLENPHRKADSPSAVEMLSVIYGTHTFSGASGSVVR